VMSGAVVSLQLTAHGLLVNHPAQGVQLAAHVVLVNVLAGQALQLPPS
jgi:hypothetical protein